MERVNTVLHDIWKVEKATFVGDDVAEILDGWSFVLKAIDCFDGSMVILQVREVLPTLYLLSEGEETFGYVFRVIVV